MAVITIAIFFRQWKRLTILFKALINEARRLKMAKDVWHRSVSDILPLNYNFVQNRSDAIYDTEVAVLGTE